MLRFVRPMLAAAAYAGLLAGTVLAYPVDPDQPAVILNNAEVPGVVDKLIVRRDYSGALRLIDEGLKANPHAAQLRFQRCVTYERMSDRAGAQRCLEQFILTYPEIPEPYNNLAGTYSRDGRLDEAEQLLVKAIALRPDFSLAHANLGNLYLARAKNAYKSAISTGGGNQTLKAKVEAIDNLLAQ